VDTGLSTVHLQPRQDFDLHHHAIAGRWGYQRGAGTVVPCKTAPEAIHAILEGWTAVIPLDDWKALTRKILGTWCDPEWIEGRIHFAETGKLK
jgi:hypothetical protein